METWTDWTPVFRLMILGLLIAAGPLAWVWLRARGASTRQRLRLLSALTLFLTFDLVLFGAFTRLTDSAWGVQTGRAATGQRRRSARTRISPPRRPRCRRGR
jgi:heme A synthase